MEKPSYDGQADSPMGQVPYRNPDFLASDNLQQKKPAGNTEKSKGKKRPSRDALKAKIREWRRRS